MTIPIEMKKNSIIKFSPVFELIPHSYKFHVPVILIFNDFEFKKKRICLYKQENNEAYKLLGIWDVYLPKIEQKKIIEFELDSFSFAFIGLNDYPSIDEESIFREPQTYIDQV